jgi:glycosyltransferase involved in cell wall biosynthesis
MSKLLYVCEVNAGGLMDYAILQCNELSKAGIAVTFLCNNSFPISLLSPKVKVIQFLPANPPVWLSGKFKTLWMMTRGLNCYSRQVYFLVKKERFKFILFSFYKEYFAPFWVGPLRKLKKSGVTMGAIGHDPVRDFIIGPRWWHKYCIRTAFSFLSHIFVHDDTPIDFGGEKPVSIKVHQIPFGSYPLSEPKESRAIVREKLGFAPTDIVFFAFGQIRDGKNLDLFLQAMTKIPANIKLLVAGKGHSESSRPPEYYQNLANKLGIASRCRWEFRYVPDEEVGELFNAIDFTLLTYSKKFRSMSAVLATALTAKKPVLASSGTGPLKTVVEKYNLGVFVEPDDFEEIVKGASKLVPSSATGDRKFGFNPKWDRYERENSWEQNAALVKSAFFENSTST